MDSNMAACQHLKREKKKNLSGVFSLVISTDMSLFVYSNIINAMQKYGWPAATGRICKSCSWIVEFPYHIMLNTIMQTYFLQWLQHKIMALIYTLTSSKCFVCKLAAISGMEMWRVSCIHLLLPGGLREICYGLLTWELLIRTETKPCVELD